ncbi:NAD(P)/FAD-dependent oxidoreductase [Candidatus Oscillochloris fontis]|uniref:NAD(P)/FAD-dependent oxidoreductase n=1 Tax=Candidatus Oscillochloris fontis TaxID=2496868 RepID=UPI0013761E96|nr:FAD-dependent oxidoreductase [Candidatus Oscillochloris fontis]
MATQYVIVGSGVAGVSAAEVLRTRAPQAQVTLISAEAAGFYSRPGLAYYLNGRVPERQLILRSPASLRDLGVRWVQARVNQINVAQRRLKLADGQEIAYDRLLLATGSRAVPADMSGSELEGVCYLDTLDDARHLVQRARRAKTAVVVGGGITALELAEGLHARGVHVHYLLRGDRYWANLLDAEESRLVEDRLRADGISIHYQTRIRQVLGTRGKLEAIETETGERIACQILAVAIGTRPQIDLARNAGIKVDRGILTDTHMVTSVPDILAAGDAAQVYDPVLGQATLDTLWPTARNHGYAAAHTMLGAPQPYQRHVAMNVTLLAGIPTTIIGAVGSGSDTDLVTIARGDSETWRHAHASWVVVERHAVNRIRLMLGERTISGAVLMGDQSLSRTIQRLIRAQADISPIRAALMQESHASPSLLTDFAASLEHLYGNHATR